MSSLASASRPCQCFLLAETSFENAAWDSDSFSSFSYFGSVADLS